MLSRQMSNEILGLCSPIDLLILLKHFCLTIPAKAHTCAEWKLKYPLFKTAIMPHTLIKSIGTDWYINIGIC